MAALVRVDAHRRGEQAPDDPFGLSVYLLRRERAYWQALHRRAENSRSTAPSEMGRAVYTAILTGPLSYPAACTVLEKVGLNNPAVDTIIDDHRFCYPPDDEATVLEPLRPDHLAEDLIALATPGHDYASSDHAWSADPWTLAATDHLLVAPNGTTPEWSPQVMTTIVESARRWRHVRTELLYPLLRERPAVLVSAGAGPLSRFASLPDIPSDVLRDVFDALPDHDLNLAPGIAAVSARQLAEQLAVITDPGRRATLYLRHSSRLRSVGVDRESIDAQQRGVELLRAIPDDPTKYSLVLQAVNELGFAYWRIGNYDEALVSFEENLEYYRSLNEDDAMRAGAGYAQALTNVGNVLGSLGRTVEAAERQQEAIVMYEACTDQSDDIKAEMGVALLNLSGVLARLEKWVQSADAARRAVSTLESLAIESNTSYGIMYANALRLLGGSLANCGQSDEGLTVAKRAVSVARELLPVHPEAEKSLGDALHNLGVVLFRLDRVGVAVETTESAVQIRRRQAEQGVSERDTELAMSLANLQVGLIQLGRNGEALAVGAEEVAVRQRLAVLRPSLYGPKLAWTLFNFAGMLYESGQFTEAIAELEKAAAWYRHLMSGDKQYRRTLARVLETLGVMLAESGNPVRAREVDAELEELGRYRTIDDFAMETALHILDRATDVDP